MQGKRPETSRRKRSSILYLVTLLIILVFVAFAVTSWLISRQTQESLVNKSRDKLIQGSVEDIAAMVNNASRLLVPIFVQKLGAMKPEEVSEAFRSQRITEAQHELDRELKRWVDAGLPGMEYFMVVVFTATSDIGPTVYLCNDENLVYKWEIPDYLLQAIEEEKPYLLMEDGIPELDLGGPQVVTFHKLPGVGTDTINYTLSVKSLEREITDIEAFFHDQRKSANLLFALAFIIALAVLVTISYFVLSHLLRKRITEPIEELAEAAGQVMEGNLDVEIRVHEGGDFAILERAFKEMVESFRKYIARSVGDE